MFDAYNDILQIEDVCEILCICSNTAYELIRNGSLKAFRCGKGWKIQKTDLIEYIESQAKVQK